MFSEATRASAFERARGAGGWAGDRIKQGKNVYGKRPDVLGNLRGRGEGAKNWGTRWDASRGSRASSAVWKALEHNENHKLAYGGAAAGIAVGGAAFLVHHHNNSSGRRQGGY